MAFEQYKTITFDDINKKFNAKVDKVDGKILSTNDYTTAEKDKLAGIAAGAQVNTVTSVNTKTGAVSLTYTDVGAAPAHDHPYLSTSGDGTVNGNITANGFYINSLRKLKENIIPTTIKAVNLINSQEIVDFNYINDPNKQHKVGLIADDSNSLFLDKKGETVDLYNTCGILMKAVQELSERVRELENKLK